MALLPAERLDYHPEGQTHHLHQSASGHKALVSLNQGCPPPPSVLKRVVTIPASSWNYSKGTLRSSSECPGLV